MKAIAHKFFELLGHTIWIFCIALDRGALLFYNAIKGSLLGSRPQDKHMQYVLVVFAVAGLMVIAKFFGKPA